MDDDLKNDMEIMRSIPPAGNILKPCSCGADDMDIHEFDDGNFNFYVGLVICNVCKKEVKSNALHPADVIWNMDEYIKCKHCGCDLLQKINKHRYKCYQCGYIFKLKKQGIYEHGFETRKNN